MWRLSHLTFFNKRVLFFWAVSPRFCVCTTTWTRSMWIKLWNMSKPCSRMTAHSLEINGVREFFFLKSKIPCIKMKVNSFLSRRNRHKVFLLCCGDVGVTGGCFTGTLVFVIRFLMLHMYSLPPKGEVGRDKCGQGSGVRPVLYEL